MIKTISVLAQNQGAVLPKILALFSHRAVPILSLSLAVTQEPEVSSLVFAIDGGNHLVEQLKLQISALVEVIEVKILEKESMISCELLLLKVKATVKTRQDILTICQLTQATVVDIAPSALTIQAIGQREFLDSIVAMLRPYDILEVIRSGTVALEKME